MVTSQQVEEIAKTIWPLAQSIAVTPNKVGRFSGGITETQGFKLAVTGGEGLIALISAQSLDGIKTKLEQRSQKKNWGRFD